MITLYFGEANCSFLGTYVLEIGQQSKATCDKVCWQNIVWIRDFMTIMLSKCKKQSEHTHVIMKNVEILVVYE